MVFSEGKKKESDEDDLLNDSTQPESSNFLVSNDSPQFNEEEFKPNEKAYNDNLNILPKEQPAQYRNELIFTSSESPNPRKSNRRELIIKVDVPDRSVSGQKD